jgi:hypothetical protein
LVLKLVASYSARWTLAGSSSNEVTSESKMDVGVQPARLAISAMGDRFA